LCIQTAYSMIQGKLASSIGSRGDVGQIGEVLTRVLCHNMCVLIRAAHDLGVEPNSGSGSGVEPEIFI
jgi:hypothetical protein